MGKHLSQANRPRFWAKPQVAIFHLTVVLLRQDLIDGLSLGFGNITWVLISHLDKWSAFFYSAFFTSVWLWLYVASIVIIKLLRSIRAAWVKVVPYLDIEKKPVIAIGRVAGLLAGAGYAVILGFIWIGRHWH